MIHSTQSGFHRGDLLKAMRGTFEKARASQPAIIFIDELDSFGDRARFTGPNAQYQREVLNGLLECIDGIQGRQGILVVAATNDLAAIDPALTRGGRLERHVRIDLPDATEGGEILAFHLRSPVSPETLRRAVEDLAGWSGADLEMLARDARRRARAAGRPVNMGDVIDALPPLQIVPAEVAHRVAFHESGHAVVALALEPNRKVGIAMRKHFRTSSASPARGETRLFSNERATLKTRGSLEAAICFTLGGAAAEEVVLGVRSTGSGGAKESDLGVATAIAAQIVNSYGLGRGLAFLMEDGDVNSHGIEKLDVAARRGVEGILAEQLARAKAMLSRIKRPLRHWPRSSWKRKNSLRTK